jgi:DNA polymerase I-like protein with 3'-5' exonuclease and polymerase domains
MIRCAEKGLDVPDCRMLLQVHDSIVWEIREDLVPFYTPVIKETMEAVDYEFGVKFKADVHAWSLAA